MSINHNIRKMIVVLLLLGLGACGDDDICRSRVDGHREKSWLAVHRNQSSVGIVNIFSTI